MVDPNWRTYGSPSKEMWRSVIEQAGGPPELAGTAAWAAAGDHGWLALAMLAEESGYGTQFLRNVAANKNPLNLRPPTGNGYLRYDTWSDGVRAWRERITDPAYKEGVYGRTGTVRELIKVYAPGSDDNRPEEYAQHVLTRLERWGAKGEPVTITFGKVPYPAVIQSHLPASNPYVVEGGAPDIPEAMFWHRMIGSWEGTNGWFHGGHAATAYGVSVVATDGHGGKIYEWIKPRTGWYGESSGPAVGPYGDGSKLIAQVGVNGVNRTTKAIEISGNGNTPLDPASRKAIIALTAYWADQKQIPWSDFPILPSGRSFVIWHNEITGMTYKTCPAEVVMNETPALIAATAELMRSFQESVPAKPQPTYAKPILPAWWHDQIKENYPGDKSEGGVKIYVCRRNVVATEETRRLDRPPSKNAKRTGPNVKKGEKLHVERWRSDGSWMTIEGHYVSQGKTSPRVTMKARD